MEKLLHWSIANAQGDDEAIAKAGQPDPKLLQQLFGGGPDEPTLMKQAIAVIMNPEAELDNKLIAFDNFEMLIENLDNANNIENLKLWGPLIEILDSPEEELRVASLSVIGTAVQNNSKSQESFVKNEGGLEKVIGLAKDTTQSSQVRTKSFYALSSLVRHNSTVCELVVQNEGLDLIKPVLNDSSLSEKLKLRVLAFLAAILTTVNIEQSFLDSLRKDKLIESSIDFLDPSVNIYLIDRALNFLAILSQSHVKFEKSEITKLQSSFKKLEALKNRLNEEDYETVRQILE
ncbi:Hsp70 nucleotide exchange factor FES1 Ecym_3484 [Eremothecium cymbalariae DBVPG|uniref:Hsp70 nucleotide exchange factor FES1 n=1 Tax=Eremothecium cymbalariae (strain CBS 270.75 / DBVPG 7215 / KCTC 17166 / NRRL Y-17582) TaxID=931890 RepID=G8JS48_ERECY|nr:Hypothetical protein Ecym_3484 [Eremothecium cymbalariae DBVPG\